jgi:cytochrome c-type biogenesis protein
MKAVTVFTAVRSLVTGIFGALIAFLGQHLIALQTGIWLIFGLIYLAIGIALLVGRAGLVKWNIDLTPAAWKRVQNPIVLGLAFGLNIPACAAPILFGLLALAATTGTVLTGFTMMFVFGFFLSFPLVVFAAVPKLTDWLAELGQRMRQMTWLIGSVFILLGAWSIWFGLFVDPANWVGK